MKAKKYRNKSETIRAIQLTPDNELDVLHFVNGGREGGGIGQDEEGIVRIHYLTQANLKAVYGEYILKIDNKVYSCSADQFERTYEPVAGGDDE